MTDEEKAAIAAAAEAEKNREEADPANADDLTPDPAAGEGSGEAHNPDLSAPDYEAIAEAERKRAEAAELAAAEEAFKRREASRRAGLPPPVEDDPDKPLTRSEFESLMREERHKLQKDALEGAAMQFARSHTANEAEARAVVQFYKSRVVPTDNLEEDILFAVGGLRHRQVIAEKGELARKIRSQETAGRSSATVHREQAPAGEPKLSPQDAAVLKQQGMSWDGARRVYRKPLGNGSKFFNYDPKSKRRWVE